MSPETIDLPPKFAIKDYLKRQEKRLQNFNSETSRSLLQDWTAAYQSKRLPSARLTGLGEKFADFVTEAGGFSVRTEYTPGRRAFPQRERVKVTGHLLEPVGLGHGWWQAETAYVENAVLLRTVNASFGPKKANIGVGIGCVALTQHLLERVYERTEIDRPLFGALIEREFAELLHAFALAETASLWIEEAEGSEWCRTTAVPYSNGLLIANERFLFGELEDGDFGYRFEVPIGKQYTPFVNPKKLVEDLGGGQFMRGDARPILLSCGVTYMNILTLDHDESEYYYLFKSLMEKIGSTELGVVALSEYGPLLPHQGNARFVLQDRFLSQTRRLSKLLASGWLKLNVSKQMYYLLPYNHSATRS